MEVGCILVAVDQLSATAVAVEVMEVGCRVVAVDLLLD